MDQESFDLGDLEWDMSQKTVTAWSAHVAPRTRGRRTYSRRLSTGTIQRKSTHPEGSPISTSPEEKAFEDAVGDRETDSFPSLDSDLIAIPPRRRFSRANSMSAATNDTNLRSPPLIMKRSQSVSSSSVSSTSIRSTSLSSLGEPFPDLENMHPNCDPLEEYASPKRGAGNDANKRGRKKVRSTRQFGKRGLSNALPLSTSFSNLARNGEEEPKWGRPISQSDLSPFPPKSHALNDVGTCDVESPSESSLGSTRKRGVCATPFDDFDDSSISAVSLSRSKHARARSPLFSPPSTKLSEFSIHSVERNPKASLEPALKKGNNMTIDSDDGHSTKEESDDEDSFDDGLLENRNRTRSPIPTFVPFSQKKALNNLGPKYMTSPALQIPTSHRVQNVDDVINTMPCYDDLKFTTKALRKEQGGNSLSWYVAPPANWIQSRRAAFFQWATRSLGFTFRKGGNSVSFVQISKTKGMEILEILEDTFSHHKDRCKSIKAAAESNGSAADFSFMETPMAQGDKSVINTNMSICNGFGNIARLNTIDDDLMQGISAMKLDGQQRAQDESVVTTLKFEPEPLSFTFDIEDSDDVSFREPVRASLENHASTRDLMSHLGMTPEIRKGRRRLSRPPRLSLQSVGSITSCNTASKLNLASPFPQASLSHFGLGSHMKNISFDFVGTPMMKPVEQGWGSCPINGRDWGTSEFTSPDVVEELTRRLDQTRLEAGFHDGDEVGATTASLGLDLDAACSYRDTYTAESPESKNSPSDEICLFGNGFSQESVVTEKAGRLGSTNNDLKGSYYMVDIHQNKQARRRQTSMAKHKRMSLIASAMNPRASLQNHRKSLFVRHPPQRAAPPVIPLPEKLPVVAAFPQQVEVDVSTEVKDDVYSSVLNDEDLIQVIFGYLNEYELICTASLVNSKWADAAAHAHANLMMLSIGSDDCEADVDDDDDSVEELSGKHTVKNTVSGIVERSWHYLVENYPWACFLSEGAYKSVYKVFNYNHKVEEAISVMDVDLIESTGNISVVAAELAVSVMLSSLVRRGVCPNFIATRGIFSCPFQPPAHHWGSSENKRPKGSSYCSPRPRKPKEPSKNKRGRYQYIRMELCDAGDAEEFLKEQVEEAVAPNEARLLLFQISFALHAAAVKCSLKHYDVKLLNIFLQRVKSDKSGEVIMRYGLGGHTFALRSSRDRAIIAKLADYGTANIDSDSNGKQVSIAQFTTLENTPPDFLILGDDACQGHGHDSFGLGLCMLHLFTGHAPYEEILCDVSCPPNLKKRLRQIWECEDEAKYSVVRSVILAEVYKDEEGHILEGEPDDTLYDTLYKFLVLFGIPKLSPALENSKVWVAVKATLDSSSSNYGRGAGPVRGGKKKKGADISRYRQDCRKYSLSHGNNRYIARAREALEKMTGGIELLMSLVCFDPFERASALDVLNSSFMAPLREGPNDYSTYNDDDEVLSYTSFSTQN